MDSDPIWRPTTRPDIVAMLNERVLGHILETEAARQQITHLLEPYTSEVRLGLYQRSQAQSQRNEQAIDLSGQRLAVR